MKRRILIIEDDADTRAALAAAMRDAGAEVVVAANAEEGLARLEAGPRPAVILLDLRVAHPGGDPFLRAMRADPRFEHVPVITMSMGSSLGAPGEVVGPSHKPVDVEDLRRIVESLLQAA